MQQSHENPTAAATSLSPTTVDAANNNNNNHNHKQDGAGIGSGRKAEAVLFAQSSVL